MFTECSFFTQCCTASSLCCVVDTAPDIDIFKERINLIIGKSVIKIALHFEGAERAIPSRAAHRSRPGRYAFFLVIHRDFLASCFILISCVSSPSEPEWCSVISSSLSSKIRFSSLEGSSSPLSLSLCFVLFSASSPSLSPPPLLFSSLLRSSSAALAAEVKNPDHHPRRIRDTI